MAIYIRQHKVGATTLLVNYRKRLPLRYLPEVQHNIRLYIGLEFSLNTCASVTIKSNSDIYSHEATVAAGK